MAYFFIPTPAITARARWRRSVVRRLEEMGQLHAQMQDGKEADQELASYRSILGQFCREKFLILTI